MAHTAPSTPSPRSQADIYGFSLGSLTREQAVEYARAKQMYSAQSHAWSKCIDHKAQRHLPSAAKLKKLCRGGVPPVLRGWVWFAVSGAAELQAAHMPNYYQNLVRASSLSKAIPQIELDLPRTFPGHPYLAHPEGGIPALRRILTAYSLHNPLVGYCQGLNFTVGLILVAVDRSEEAAFWLLAALVERICFPGCFNHNLSGCHVEMKTLQDLIREKLPRLGAHMESLGCDTSLIATDWFVTVFCVSMPPESACRVLDALFYEGAKVLFRVSLALLQTAEAALLRIDNAGELMRAVKLHAAGLYGVDALMSVAFDGIGPLSLSSVDAVRKAKEAEVRAFMEARRQQQARHAAQRGTPT